MAQTIKIEGMDDLTLKLKSFPGNVQKKALVSGLRKAAWVIARDARRRAPKLTGKLRRNILVRKLKRDKKNVTVQVFVRQKGDKDGPKNAFYWTYIEFGKSNQAAKPFLRPAFEANKTSVVADLPKFLAPAVQREIDKLSK